MPSKDRKTEKLERAVEQNVSRKDGMPTGKSPTSEDIARRAYEIYLQRGGASGCELEDWLRAERELTSEES